MAIIIISIFTLINGIAARELKLLEVVALSRHNMRTPLTAFIENFTPKIWPTFDVPTGQLTEKGAKMERYMGRYFYEWMNNEELLPDGCPGEEVYVYANCIERTIDTAKSFVQGAFPGCNVPVHYRNDTNWDPMFNAVIKNGSKDYIDDIRKEMKYKVDLKDYKLKPAYIMINDIVDLKDSNMCFDDYYCDLAEDKTDILATVGHTPNIKGPLYIANSIVDIFIMSFYDDKPMKEVAWGRLTMAEEWELITKITKEHQNVRFNLTSASKDVTKPLLEYMADIFLGDLNRKFTLLVAHDSNIGSLINALGFKPFVLPHQYEPFPVGGKLVFQKWTDGFNVFLKVDYIYQSWNKLRNGSVVNLAHPPQIYTMEMKGCPIDKAGYCLWTDFVNLLQDTLYGFEH